MDWSVHVNGVVQNPESSDVQNYIRNDDTYNITIMWLNINFTPNIKVE